MKVSKINQSNFSIKN